MTDVVGTSRIGEDFRIVVAVPVGDQPSVTSVTAKIQEAGGTKSNLVFNRGAPSIALTVTATAEGWELSLPAASTISFKEGWYGVDARFVVGAAVEITERSAFVEFSRPAGI